MSKRRRNFSVETIAHRNMGSIFLKAWQVVCLLGFSSVCGWAGLFAAASLTSPSQLQADELDLLPADRPVEEVIDFYIDRQLQAKGITPTPQADDSALLRRMTLDIVGRIPTATEAQAYLAAPEPDKRTILVDRLMASPGFARQQATHFNVMLMQEQRTSIWNYLHQAFQSQRSWDQIFRELILAEEKPIPADMSDEEKNKIRNANQVAQFVKRRVNDADVLTNDVSVLFFGVNVSCAKCHDHPLVHDWKQDHFYGMKSFFSRTFENGEFLGERDYGLVKFKTTAGEDRDAKLMFITGEVLTEPAYTEPNDEQKKQEQAMLEKAKADKLPPPSPSYSRRQKLLEVALKPGENNFFARSIVNRMFQRYFGEGLVSPVDQMHSGNPVTHPELLAWLARDMETHGYQLPRLIRGILLSKAYARTSFWEGENRPYSGYYAVAQVRPLMPHQLAMSLRLAAQSPAEYAATNTPEVIEQRLNGLDQSSHGLADLFDVPNDSFEVGVTEALLFSNNQRLMNEMVSDGGGRLVNLLKDLPDNRAKIEAATWNVFSRAPREEEIQALDRYLTQRAQTPLPGCQQMVWAMMTSTEFRFNY
jgi:hypothetical protein